MSKRSSVTISEPFSLLSLLWHCPLGGLRKVSFNLVSNCICKAHPRILETLSADRQRTSNQMDTRDKVRGGLTCILRLHRLARVEGLEPLSLTQFTLVMQASFGSYCRCNIEGRSQSAPNTNHFRTINLIMKNLAGGSKHPRNIIVVWQKEHFTAVLGRITSGKAPFLVDEKAIHRKMLTCGYGLLLHGKAKSFRSSIPSSGGEPLCCSLPPLQFFQSRYFHLSINPGRSNWKKEMFVTSSRDHINTLWIIVEQTPLSLFFRIEDKHHTTTKSRLSL